jgi:FkbM family methyltransferase
VANLLRRVLPVGVSGVVWEFVRLMDPYVLASYSQEGEDMIVRRLFEGCRDGFYVDVGAHHPMRYSNTCYFYGRGWRGINIDPDPVAMEMFHTLRPRDVNLTLGISDQPGNLLFHVFNDRALNTFDSELAARRGGLPAYQLIDRREVEVRRLDDVLAEHLPPDQLIHLMSIDAEGYDLKALQSNDWERYRPRCLLVEALRTTLEALEDSPVHRFMASVRYRLLAKTVNTLIYLDGRQS